MPLGNQPDGAQSAAEFIVSPLPWVTASTVTNGTVHYRLPYLSQWISLRNDGNPTIRLAFTFNGISSSNFISVPVSSSWTGVLRLRDVFIDAPTGGSFTFVAGLTGIPSRMLPTLTGSTASGSMGWPGVG